MILRKTVKLAALPLAAGTAFAAGVALGALAVTALALMPRREARKAEQPPPSDDDAAALGHA